MTSSPPPTHPADLELSSRALAAEPQARRTFAERMGCVPRMLTVLNRRLPQPLPREDIEDLVQDTLITIWRRLADYAGRASLETWAYPFCRFQLANRVRSAARRSRHVTVEVAPPVKEATTRFDEFEDLARAMEKLDFFTAEIIRLKHYEQLSFVELAGKLQLSPNTAKTRYYRGINRLRILLAPSRRELWQERPAPARGPGLRAGLECGL